MIVVIGRIRMKINKITEIYELLEYCRAVPFSETSEGDFYKAMTQSFKCSDGTVQNREYLNKKKVSIVVPIAEENAVIFVIQLLFCLKKGL